LQDESDRSFVQSASVEFRFLKIGYEGIDCSDRRASHSVGQYDAKRDLDRGGNVGFSDERRWSSCLELRTMQSS
jgi:hypothetical protein